MSKKIAHLSLFIAFATILSYIEILIPFNFGIPGVKLGLANFFILLALYNLGTKEAFIINLVRIIIIGFAFGNLFSILFSLAGALISFIFMYLAKRTRLFSIITVSIIGGVSHNIAQIVVASIVVNTYGILYYVPVLIIAGFITGLIIGLIANLVKNKLNYILKQNY